MEAFAVCRIRKIKSPSLKATGDHNLRLINVPQANEHGKISRIIGGKKHTSDLVKEQIEKQIIKKPRKDAVVAVEMVLSASPEYFRPENPDKHGQFNDERVQKWKEKSVAFLKEKYKSNLVEVTLHLDEATPHLHAIIVPLTTSIKNKRRTKKQIKDDVKPKTYKSTSLNAKDMFDKHQLVKLQTEYANSLSELGIKRGIAGSNVKNKRLDKHYRQAFKRNIPKNFPAEAPVIESPPSLLENRNKWLEQQNKKIEDAFLLMKKRIASLTDLAIKQRDELKDNRSRTFKVADMESQIESFEVLISDLKAELTQSKQSHKLDVKSLEDSIQDLHKRSEGIVEQNRVLLERVKTLNKLKTPTYEDDLNI